MLRVVTLLLVCLCGSFAWAGRDTQDVRAASQAWAKSLSSGKVAPVLEHYAPRAKLWGTFSNVLRKSKPKLREYFTHLQKKQNLAVKFSSGDAVTMVAGGKIALHEGAYTFSFDDGGKRVEVPARYSFTYGKADDGAWKILSHHSSVLPDPAK